MAETPMIIKDLTLGTDTATAYNFPSADGANTEVLTTDGAGNLSFAAGGGSMSSFTVDGDTGTPQTISNGDTLSIVNAAGGSIKTVAQGTDTITIDIAVSGVTPGSYTNSDITVNNQGIITAAADGSAGGGGGPSAGSLQSLQCTWPGATQQWVCVNEANVGWEDSTSITMSNDLKWSHGGTSSASAVVEYYPIYFPRDMTIDYTSHIAAAFSGTPTIDFAIFASDANNFPTGSQLLSWQITIPNTTFNHVETSVAATAFTKGLYFLAIDASSSSAYMLGNFAGGFPGLNTVSNASYKYGPAVTPFCNFSQNTDSITGLNHSDFSWWLAEVTATTIPATITQADLILGGDSRSGQESHGMVIPGCFVRESS